MKRLLFLMALLLLAPCLKAQQVINASSCQESAVSTAIGQINSDGAIVNVPSGALGACVWSSTLTVNQTFSFSLIGQTTCTGTPATSCTDNTVFTDSLNSDNPILQINTIAGKSFRLSGITFQEQGVSTTKFEGTLRVTGGSTSVRLDHIHFNLISVTSVRLADVYGVIDHSVFSMSGNTWNGIKFGKYGTSGQGNETWAAPTALGTSQFFYVEDSSFDVGTGNDCDHGGRFIFRHNSFTNGAELQTHPTGGSGPDARGCRAWEIYQNTFTGTSTFNAMFASSGTGVFWGNSVQPGYQHVLTIHSMLRNNNTYTEQPTPTGWGYCGTSSGLPGNGSAWDQNTVASTGYACLDQPGRGQGQLLTGVAPNKINSATNSISWPNQALEPVYEWLTTGWSGSTNNYAVAFESDVEVNNQDYYLWCNASSSNGCTTYDGTHGVGSGLLSARPTTCTAGVGFWATDTSTLYKCSAGNAWGTYYTPFTYPHPLTQGGSWTFYQDSIATFCAANTTTCNITINAGQGLKTAPVTDVWIVTSNVNHTTSGTTITNVVGGGGTWIHCPNCANAVSGQHDTDAWYNLTGTPSFAGTITVTLSANSGTSTGWAQFIELIPPPGTTPTFDTSGHIVSGSCTTCNAVQLTTTGTDVIFQQLNWRDPSVWNAWSSPYITNYAADGVLLNSTTGLQAQPTVQVSGSGSAQIMALAFGSTAGTFTPTPQQFSVKNFTAPQAVNCNNACTAIPIPATTAGNLLYIESGNLGSHIVSVSGGGTWTVDPNCAISMSLAGNDNLSCAYNTSVTANTTQLNVTMSGSASTYFAIWEIADANGGTFSLDKIGKTTNAASPFPSGQSLSITGPNDVIFQAAFVPGGTSSWTYMPLPRIIVPGAGGQFFINQAAQSVILNSGPVAPTPNWNDQQNQTTIVTGAAFTTSGGPPPPTCTQPVISNVVATPAANGTQTTITWTTSVAADSLVVYGINNAGNLTPITDAGGVPSHSVTLSNLLPSTQYGFGIRSRAIVSGSPCGSAFYAFVDNTQQFTTSAPPAGTADYYIVPDVSPQFVTQGFGVYLGLRINNLVGTVPNNTVSVVVTGLPNFVSLTWTNQQVLGVAGTVSTTTVTNDTLKLFQLANTELRILTNQGGTTTPGAYTLTFTASGTGVSTHTATMSLTVDAAATPFGIAFPFGTPSSYPTIPNLSTYKSTATTYGPIHCAQDLDVSPRTIRPNDNANLTPVGPAIQKSSWYYDGVRVYWNVQNLTQDGNNYEQCRANIRAVYRDGYIIPNNGAVQVFTMFPEGPYLDVVNQSDNTSLHELNLMDANTYAPGNEVQVSVRYLQREVAYSLKSDIFANTLGQNNARFSQPTSFWLAFHLDHVLGHLDQICRSQNADYWETFMTGLEADALIDYYNNVSQDPRIPSAIKCLADYIFTNAWQTISDDPGAFQYDKWRGATNFGIANGGASSMVPLDMLIAPMYAWLFSKTGLTVYQTEGDTIWNHGVLLDGAAGGIANQLNQAYPGGNSGKLFSQQYYWGPSYVTWRSTPVSLPPVFSPSSGSYTTPQSVTITSPTAGATICYTNDGTVPTANGSGTCVHGTTLTNGGTVTVSFSQLLQAIATTPGTPDSTVSSASYTFQTSPASSAFAQNFILTIGII